MELQGIGFVSGKKEVLDNAIKKGSAKVLQQQKRTTADYVKELMEVDSLETQDEVKIESIELLQNLTSKMKKLKISGNEFVMFFNNAVRRFGILNENLERSFVGEVINEGESKNYERKIWLKEKQTDETGKYLMYLIDTKTLDISDVTVMQMREKLKSGELVYEHEERQMTEFELGDE